MADMKNKVKYGLKNAHYAPLTVDEAGNATFATPIPIPGSVSLTMDAQGDTETFYADNMAYFVSAANDGYSGSFEVAIIPDSFRQDILNISIHAPRVGSDSRYTQINACKFAHFTQFLSAYIKC